jgi:hypothetical protein
MTDLRQNLYAPLGLRNNNPGNIRPGYDWLGKTTENHNFVVFDTLEHGLRALALDLFNKQKKGLNTVNKIISKYAPPSENNTAAYVRSVCLSVGVEEDEPLALNKEVLKRLVRAICRHENGRNGEDGHYFADELISDDMILEAISMLPELALSQLPD